MKEKVNFIVATVMKIWAQFRSKTTFTMPRIQTSSFHEQIIGNSPEIIHFETWAWSWS